MNHQPQPSAALEAAARRRRELREALVALEAAISSPLRDRETWRRTVLERLDMLRAAFDEHVGETESEGGLYDEMAEIAPHLSGKARRLREDHAPIAGLLDDAYRQVAVPFPPDADLDQLRDDLQRLMGRIVRHRQQGADLVWEAYAIDIGSAG
jgi:hypothetical protein